jgi:hypothetical protein
MRPYIVFQSILALVAAAAGLLLAGGCAQAPQLPAWRYLQRSNVRVGIIPASNQTTQVGAPLIIDKAWEEALRKSGFVVVNADSVVTYLSSRSVSLAKLLAIPTAQLGNDLHVDYLLEDEIENWGTKYHVIVGGAVVSCKSRLIEASTGATVWASDWTMQEQSDSNGNGLGGALMNALVTAIADSMFDKSTQLARQGVALQSTSQPYPGVAPAVGAEP